MAEGRIGISLGTYGFFRTRHAQVMGDENGTIKWHITPIDKNKEYACLVFGHIRKDEPLDLMDCVASLLIVIENMIEKDSAGALGNPEDTQAIQT